MTKKILSDPKSGLNGDLDKQHRQVLKTQCVTSTEMEQKMHMYAISDIKSLKIKQRLHFHWLIIKIYIYINSTSNTSTAAQNTDLLAVW